MNGNIVRLVERLSDEYGVSKDDAMKDVMRKENKLYIDRFYLKEGVLPMNTSYFYSAIGRVHKQYKLKEFENNMVKNIYRKNYGGLYE